MGSEMCIRDSVEGEGLLEVLGVRGVRGVTTRSTHIAEVEKTLGIEAARQVCASSVQASGADGAGLHTDATYCPSIGTCTGGKPYQLFCGSLVQCTP